jgi:hypothetical protein
MLRCEIERQLALVVMELVEEESRLLCLAVLRFFITVLMKSGMFQSNLPVSLV